MTERKLDKNSFGSGNNSSFWGKITLIEAVKTSAADTARVWTSFPEEKANILQSGKKLEAVVSFSGADFDLKFAL